MSERETRMRVVRREEVAEAVVALTFQPVDGAPPAWSPGAHIDLVLDLGLERQYSLCGRAGEFRIAVLREDQGRGGSAWVHEKVHEGDEVIVRGPRNHFVLEDAADYQFIAGGIGITPILPMIEAVEAKGARWSLAYGGRRRDSMAFLAELAAHAGRVGIYPQDETGLLDLKAILGEPVPGRRVYCCGPEPLLEAVEAAMSVRPQEHLHVERFAPKAPVDLTGAAFEVEAAASGKSVRVDEGESIIDALGRVGITVEFSCREGTCGTCETTVISGEPDHRDFVLTPEERAANDCMMICVGRCVRGPLVLDL